VSIHWKSPMGPIRFDLSKVLSSQDYDRTESFRFSTSTQF
jgi:outer membrane protein insertion porin family